MGELRQPEDLALDAVEASYEAVVVAAHGDDKVDSLFVELVTQMAAVLRIGMLAQPVLDLLVAHQRVVGEDQRTLEVFETLANGVARCLAHAPVGVAE